MTKYMKNHEVYVLSQLHQLDETKELFHYHSQQIAYLQHERLIHLLVMILTCSLFIASFITFLFNPQISFLLLVTLLGCLAFSYILHYYRLENTVQRWYLIANTIHQAQTGIGTNLYEQKK